MVTQLLRNDIERQLHNNSSSTMIVVIFQSIKRLRNKMVIYNTYMHASSMIATTPVLYLKTDKMIVK